MTTDNFADEIKRQFPFLDDIKEEMSKKFMETVMVGKYPAGMKILEEGSSCTNMVLVLDGTIRVYKLSPEGKEMTLYRLNKGETCVLSVACLMGNTNYPAIAEVEEEATLGIIPAGFYNELFLTEPSCQKFIFNTVSSRLQEVLILVDELVFKSMDKRLAGFILERMTENEGEYRIDMTHEKIAVELGTAREVVSRILKEFEKKNIVNLSRGRIIVKDAESLKKISEL